jgi:hypothetical protein
MVRRVEWLGLLERRDMLTRSDDGDAASVKNYEPSWDARLNYLEYLMAEPQMDQALEAMAALHEEQRQILIAFLRQLGPGEALDIDDQHGSLSKRRAA